MDPIAERRKRLSQWRRLLHGTTASRPPRAEARCERASTFLRWSTSTDSSRAPGRGYPAPRSAPRARARMATIRELRTRAGPPVLRVSRRGGCPASPPPASRGSRSAPRARGRAFRATSFDNLRRSECPTIRAMSLKAKDLRRAASANIPYIGCRNSQGAENKGLRRMSGRCARCVQSERGAGRGPRAERRSDRNVHRARVTRSDQPVLRGSGRGAEGARSSYPSRPPRDLAARARIRKSLRLARIGAARRRPEPEHLALRPRRARPRKSFRHGRASSGKPLRELRAFAIESPLLSFSHTHTCVP